MIKFAGVVPLLPTPEVEDYIRRFLPAEWSRYFYAPASGTELGATDTVVPQFNWQRVFEPKINQLIWPTGASRWSSMLLLVTDEKLAYIKVETELNSEYSSHRPLAAQLVLSDSTFSTTPASNGWTLDGKQIALSTRMYAMDARPVSVPFEYKLNEETDEWEWIASEDRTLWVLPLVDDRWFWQWTKVAVTPDTGVWSSTIQSVANELGTADTISSVAGGYDAPVDVMRPLFNVNAALATDAIANIVGHRVVRQIGDAFQIVNATNAISSWASNFDGSRVEAYEHWQIIAGGDYTGKHYESATLPNFIRVVFSGGGEENVELREVGGYQWGKTNSAATVFVSASPRDRRAFAVQVATDWLAWRTKKADITFAGIKAWQMTGFEDFVTWTIDSDGGIQTRVVTHPTNLAMVQSGDGNGPIYYALPQCDGIGIPKARDVDHPGKAYCCLYWLKIDPAEGDRTRAERTILPVLRNGKIAREWVHNPYPSYANDCEYHPVGRMGNGALTLLSMPTGSDCTEPGTLGSPTSSPTTTAARSTTTTSSATGCGRTMCKMTWNHSTKTWTKDSGCTATTSTSSTTSSTTTASGGTTTSGATTTGCICPLLTPEEGPWLTSTTSSTTSSTTTAAATTTSGATTSEGTTTSSTTTTDACQCEWPTFCGKETGECTYTACSKLRNKPPSCGGTTTSTSSTTSSTTSPTTTCDCSTSTTTPEPTGPTTTGDPATSTTYDPNNPPPPPCEGCTFTRKGYGPVEWDNQCGGVCSCPYSWGYSIAPCSSISFPCLKPTGTAGPPSPPRFCGGDCSWAGTSLLASTCEGTSGCHCNPPEWSVAANCGNSITPCGFG